MLFNFVSTSQNIITFVHKFFRTIALLDISKSTGRYAIDIYMQIFIRYVYYIEDQFEVIVKPF